MQGAPKVRLRHVCAAAASFVGVLILATVAWADPAPPQPPPPPPPPPVIVDEPPIPAPAAPTTTAAPTTMPPTGMPRTGMAPMTVTGVPVSPTATTGAFAPAASPTGVSPGQGPAPDLRARPEPPPPPGWAVPEWDLDWRSRAAGLGPPLPPPDPFDPQPIRYRPDTTYVTLDARRMNPNRVPQWIDVIERRDLVAWRPMDIGDLARWLPNVMIGDGGNPSLQMPNIRGFGRERVRILTDGVWPASQALGYHGGTLSLWDPESTERVEIYHGPGAYLKGIDAPGGMINIVPRRPRRHGRLSADAAVAGGYQSAMDKWRGRAEADIGQDRFAALVGMTWTGVGDRNTGGGTLEPSSYQQLFADLAADYFLDNRSRIGVTAQYAQNSNVETPTATGSDLVDPRYDRLFLALTLSSFDMGGIFGGTRASIAIDSFFREEDQAFLTSPAGLGSEDDVKRYDFHLEGNLYLHPCHDTWSELTVSYATLDRKETILSNGDLCGGGPNGDCGIGVVREYSAEEIQLTWLVEDQYHSECWDLYGGLRLDYYHLEDNRDDTTNDEVLVGGAVGACRHLNKRLTAYGNASLGWRRPSLYERTATAVVDGAVVFGNPDLDPEMNGNLELGLKGALKNRVSLQAAAFAHYADRFIAPLALAPAIGAESRLENLGDVWTYGGELEAAWRPWTTIEGTELFGSVGITRSSDTDLVANVPLLYRTGIRHSVPSPRGWRMRRWFAEAAAWGASNSRDGVRGDDAFVTVDALIGCGIDLGCFRRIDASFGVTNILDADYTPPGAVLAAPGVSLLASFGVKF